MIDIRKNLIKETMKRDCKIEELKKIREEILKCSNAYRDVFNGTPFFESWTTDSAKEEIEGYINASATILVPKYKQEIIGFLVAMNGVPENQKQFVPVKDQEIKFVEEVGVLARYRGNLIASEMVRILILNYLLGSQNYIGYRTNAMRYFETRGSESFESVALRTQLEDTVKRANGEKIIIPEFSDSEKQKFINRYIEMIKNMPDYDVSNSNALFRSIFGNIDFCSINGNYSFQKDPTGEGNDRIFPIIDLSEAKTKKMTK